MDTKFFYSSSENSFYPADLLENYEAAGTLPDDLIGVDEGIFLKFTQTPPEGKRAARTVLTGMCYSVGSATRQGSSSLTRFIGQSAMTSRT
ncbi:hypothetical protein CGB72_03605 [Klebsiella pneumoniae]|nr:hypothetical protein [Klebsiella pneumoniae]